LALDNAGGLMAVWNLKLDIIVDGIWNEATLCSCIAKAIRDNSIFRNRIRHLEVSGGDYEQQGESEEF
jgi:hypothetical protein